MNSVLTHFVWVMSLSSTLIFVFFFSHSHKVLSVKKKGRKGISCDYTMGEIFGELFYVVRNFLLLRQILHLWIIGSVYSANNILSYFIALQASIGGECSSVKSSSKSKLPASFESCKLKINIFNFY